MASAKDIIVKVIPSSVANPFVKKHHYSGKVVQNSTLHFGAFLNGRLHGVMSFGSPTDKRKVIGLVVKSPKNGGGKEPAPWYDMLELNRMAFDDVLPPNSESRCIAIAIKLIKKNAPNIKWILSFADGTQCGDGTIYRAAGFYLTNIKRNKNLLELPDGTKIHELTITSGMNTPRTELDGKSLAEISGGSASTRAYCDYTGAKPIEGFQLRYIKIIDPDYILAVPALPYSAIQEAGAGMYKGEKR